MSRRPYHLIIAALSVTALLSATAAQAAPLEFDPITRPALPPVAVTDPAEAARVDNVPVDQIRWEVCNPAVNAKFECAELDVPLDYSKPKGDQFKLEMAKMPARKPDQKIGTLFVNPGGPGGSAQLMAYGSDFLSDEVRDRFDIVGIEPRGISGDVIAACFKDSKEQQSTLKPVAGKVFPLDYEELSAFTQVYREFGKACSRPENKLIRHMSTSDVARDMDVVRRAVGDKQLTFLGFSYGTELAQMYANMFPDRVRALASDGVVDAYSWSGQNNENTNQDIRLWSGYGSERAMNEAIDRCAAAGSKCAGGADIRDKFDTVVKRLQQGPIELTDPGTGQLFSFRYDTLGANVLQSLYMTGGAEAVVGLISELHSFVQPASKPAPASTLQLIAAYRKVHRDAPGDDPNYSNEADMYLGVSCTDGRHPKIADSAGQMWRVAQTQPITGRVWAVGTLACGRDAFTARNELTYLGPWGKRTSNPLLFVGNEWDPATYVRQAVSASKRHPGSNVVIANNWGHTAYGTGQCVTAAIDEYLLRQKMPGNIQCTDAAQPFTETDESRRRIGDRPSAQEVIKPGIPWLPKQR